MGVQSSEENNREFRKKINGLIIKKCWSFIAGEGTGSVILLDFDHVSQTPFQDI